jgi:hypothetical protein
MRGLKRLQDHAKSKKPAAEAERFHASYVTAEAVTHKEAAATTQSCYLSEFYIFTLMTDKCARLESRA